ncbi:MAG: alpha/beta fold hydrolase [Geodermatophilaceae bacterium]|nr:alpha/beta fold hydrolase [Geodermatophilaceae bacterium]
MHIRIRGLVAALAVALLGASLVVTAPASATPQGPTVPDLSWQPCGPAFPGVECAKALVPLDYDDPTGERTTLQLARIPAADQANRLGSLFINPGGPGGSAVALVLFAGQFYADRLQGRFDIVGFDPRGVLLSDPLQCFDTNEEEAEFFASQPVFPYLPQQERPFFDAYNEFTARCLTHGGDIRPHMSTADVARDMDLLRRAVGDQRLSYLGLSYGSFLGNTYANLFPDRIRALVIDGVLDPRAWAAGAHIVYDRTSAQEVLEEFFRLCDEAGRPDCAFAGPEASQARYERLAEHLLAQPIVLPDGLYTYDLLIADSVGAMYSTFSWPDFAVFLDFLAAASEGAATGDQAGAARAALHDKLTAAQDDRSLYFNGFDAYFGNHCSDAEYPARFPTWSDVGRRAEAASRSGPFWWWFNAPCASWPTAEDRYTGPWTARTSGPVLVVGNYFDPATNYRGAVVNSQLLPNSRLLSYAGWGHTAYGLSECATAAMDAYLLDGTLPARGTVCPANPNPFEAATDRSGGSPRQVGLPPPWLLRPTA